MTRLSLTSIVLTAALTVGARAQDLTSYPVSLQNLGPAINSEANDYAPALAPDGRLFFTSSRSDRSIGEADIFGSIREANAWRAAANAGEQLNTEESDGSMAITADGRTVVFASDGIDDGFGDTDLYLADLVGGDVRNIRNLGEVVNGSDWDSQPAISADGTMIVFSSNRDGGRGGIDLWMTTRDSSGRWSAPRNMGPSINSEEDDRSPFLASDGRTLYFSSNGRGGFGGYDIFAASIVDDGSPAANLGANVNSAGDDLCFAAPAGSTEFFLASTRGGGRGGLDIYAGTPNIFASGVFRLTVSVLDSTTNAPLPAIITVFDETEGRAVATLTTTATLENYLQMLPVGHRYRIDAQVRGYQTRSAWIGENQSRGSRHETIRFGQNVIAQFDLGRYDVPFFVTGYYRPNTNESLRQLLPKLDGSLRDATYIERFGKGSKRHEEYQAYATTVESLFQTVYATSVEEVFPRFVAMSLPSEKLEITITGYADPNKFTGRYIENETCVFEDITGAERIINRGARIENLELSGLRAFYSGQHLDKLFTDAAKAGHPEYLKLKQEGRIVYRFVAGEVNHDDESFDARRKITITITRLGTPRGVDTTHEETAETTR